MEPRVVIVLALLGAVSAAPQLWLSEKSHLGLEQALAGRIPGIYKGYEGRGSDVIVLNILGLSNPVGRDDFDLGSPESNELLPSTGGVPLPEVLKRPRRSFGSNDDEEDRPDPFAGLPLLGSLLGSNLGRWFDETYDANVKFFRSLRITGNLALTQLDAMLEEDKNNGTIRG